ncbi:LnmK family bifunctional acyltransferase/decarboxylase [Streptomyces xanthochromogenes]|uniref:LnmK family bifunctional acyltransferase/decarboxylase n=1 Tax=Streptomyces xanthochromogenes TaxID=67384 RepID=UPI00344665F7
MTDLSAWSVSPLVLAPLELTGPASVRRLVTVTPGMCGSLKTLAATAGDWTWETVSAVCGLDVFNARDFGGAPAYLAFYYSRIVSRDVQPRQLTFGDRIEVQSQVFDAGSLSVLTVHRIRHVATAFGAEAVPFDATEAFVNPRPDCLYVENFNVWLSRRAGGGNTGLVYAPPVGFTQAPLPKLPPSYSPRASCASARYAQVLPDPGRESWVRVCPDLVVDHPVDLVDDVNGVGLLYFASFFSVAERLQLRRWRALGRSGSAFLDRRIGDFRICYLGNADIDATLSLRLRTSRDPLDPEQEKSDLLVRDVSTDRTIAVASSRYQVPSS